MSAPMARYYDYGNAVEHEVCQFLDENPQFKNADSFAIFDAMMDSMTVNGTIDECKTRVVFGGLGILKAIVDDDYYDMQKKILDCIVSEKWDTLDLIVRMELLLGAIQHVKGVSA